MLLMIEFVIESIGSVIVNGLCVCFLVGDKKLFRGKKKCWAKNWVSMENMGEQVFISKKRVGIYLMV